MGKGKEKEKGRRDRGEWMRGEVKRQVFANSPFVRFFFQVVLYIKK